MRLAVLKNLSWVALFAGPIVAAGSPEHPSLVIFALAFATSAAVTLAVINGRTTKRTLAEPLSHVAVFPPPPPRQPDPALKGYMEERSTVEDALHIASFNEYRARLDANLDAMGRTLKVGQDVHSGMCWDGHRLTCVCGMPDEAGEETA